ncbi:MAG TPA: hypothetical protein ENL09_02055 [Bacteroidetes bacterium]|nr:hypothetical protein [Bacteroidota bacterium]
MRIAYVFLSLFLSLISCKNETVKTEVKEELIMYQPSEMTELMRTIYEFNKASKIRIEDKKNLFEYPEEFQNIKTAKLADPDERDSEFDSLAIVFLKNQKAAFYTEADSVKFNFNRSINACIECHRTRCPGPLPKIRKLLIPKS